MTSTLNLPFALDTCNIPESSPSKVRMQDFFHKLIQLTHVLMFICVFSLLSILFFYACVMESIAMFTLLIAS